MDDLGDHYARHPQGSTARITIKSEDAVATVKFTTNITGTVGVQSGDILLFEGQSLVVTATTDKYVGPGGWAVALNLRGWRSVVTASPNDVTLPTFTIPEGAKSATGTITIVTDTRTEQQELFHFGGNAKRKGRTIQATPQWTRARISDSGAGLTLSTATLAPLEDEALTYTVKLNQAPTADVTVTPATSDSTKATVSGALTFTSTNWQMAQTVTVTGKADGTATITHTATSTDTSYTNLSNLPSVSVTVVEPETKFTVVVKETGESTATSVEGQSVELQLTLFQLAGTSGEEFTASWSAEPTPITGTVGVTVSHTALTVAETGATGNTATYTVRLNTRPSADVTITPATSSATNATVSGALTFSTTNWATPQEITVTGAATGSATITHAVTTTDTSYQGATVGSVEVTVAAAAVTPGTLTLSTNAPMNRVNEGGSLLVIATLNQASESGTTVTLTAGMASTATVTDDYTLTLTITIPAGKTSAWTTLSAVNDTVFDGVNPETVVLSLASTTPTLSGAGLTVTIVDDEDGVTSTVASGERLKTLTIEIPDDDVPTVGVRRFTVTVTGPTSTWTARTGKGSVTISYTDDDGGEALVAFGPNADAENAYQATVMEDVSGGTVNVPVTVSGGAADPIVFTVRALSGGTAQDGGTSCTGTADFFIANRMVTIPANGTTTNLTITICDDALGEPDETIRLGFMPARTPARTVADLYERKPAGNLQAVITIDSEDVPTSVRLDNPNHPLDASAATVREGQSVTVRATLDVPADQGGVTVTLVLDTTSATPHSTSTNPAQSGDYTFPAALTIPAGETTGTATLMLPTDQAADGPKTLRFTATTNPSLTVTFSGSLLNFEISIRDIDSPGLLVSETSVTVAAGAGSQQGTTVTYTVRLATKPSATVTVAVASDDETKATVSPATLTFTASNWQSPQQVTVQAVAEGNTRITHTATSTDGAYNTRKATLNVRVNPPTTMPPVDPPPGGGGPEPPGGGGPTGDPPPEETRGASEMRLNPENLIVQQGSSKRYGVKLSKAPTADVTVTVSSADSSRATPSHTTLTFTTTNWRQTQWVMVTGHATGSTRIEHRSSSSDSNYDNQYRSVRVLVSGTGGGTTTGGPGGPTGGGPTGGATGGGGGGGGGGFGPSVDPPRFEEGGQTSRPLPSNAKGGAAIGDPVKATQADDLALTYSIRDDDDHAALFTVDADTGQVRLKDDTELVEGETYRITVVVETESGAKAFITVVIEVSAPAHHPYDVDQDGVISFEEAIAAVRDYFIGDLTLEEVLEVVRLYLNS